MEKSIVTIALPGEAVELLAANPDRRKVFLGEEEFEPLEVRHLTRAYIRRIEPSIGKSGA